MYKINEQLGLKIIFEGVGQSLAVSLYIISTRKPTLVSTETISANDVFTLKDKDIIFIEKDLFDNSEKEHIIKGGIIIAAMKGELEQIIVKSK